MKGKIRLKLREFRQLLEDLEQLGNVPADGQRVDKLHGGLADDMDISEFDPQELALGISDEGEEHTDDPEKALEITMDHLTQDPNFYSKELGEVRRIVREELKHLHELQLGGDFDRDEAPQAAPQQKLKDKTKRSASQQVKDLFDGYDFAELPGGSFDPRGARDVSGPTLVSAGKSKDGGRFEVYSFADLIGDLISMKSTELRRSGSDMTADKSGQIRAKMTQVFAPQAAELANKVNSILGGKESGRGHAEAGKDQKGIPAVTVYYPA